MKIMINVEFSQLSNPNHSLKLVLLCEENQQEHFL